MIVGLLVLIGFQILGELTALWLNLPIPGAVIGLLFLLLSLRVLPWRKTLVEPVEQVSEKLISHLSLLFLPAGVGIFFLPEHINAQWPAVLAAMLGGTFVAMLLSSLAYRVFSARAKSRE
ncbi:CidA/LrgA family protein [Simiduia curdlanivorans]|uniref:CidA/LrgA family protein n=1 Tax=Simiduia curdlanivorans TaxID=1492769 RepID=A0ABV8V1Q5_9GAMM|nr:CidA/LrgA family protein [Simiduia curdlanivorans]MDN3637896.1 CidA/LrgA family protein [Simiduia curdlanivorans]